MCGADFPLKVSALGESSALGYVDEPVRPPGSIPSARRVPAPQPRWPMSSNRPTARRSRVYYAPPLSPARRCRSRRPAYRAAERAAEHLPATATRRAAGRICGRRRTGADRSPAKLPPRASHRTTARRRTMTSRNCRPTRGRAPRRSARREPHRPLPPCLHLDRRAVRRWPAATPVEVRPAATLACPIVSALDRWFANAVQPAAQQVVPSAGGRDQADLGLFLPRHERPARRAHFRARLRQCARHRGLRAGRRPPHHGQGRLAAARRRSRAFCATCRARPATSSPPCWRRARTSSTTTTSTST